MVIACLNELLPDDKGKFLHLTSKFYHRIFLFFSAFFFFVILSQYQIQSRPSIKTGKLTNKLFNFFFCFHMKVVSVTVFSYMFFFTFTLNQVYDVYCRCLVDMPFKLRRFPYICSLLKIFILCECHILANVFFWICMVFLLYSFIVGSYIDRYFFLP